jgi:hypothetical protein
LGMSVTANVFDAECERLAEVVIDVAKGATVPASTRRNGAGTRGSGRNGTRAPRSRAGRPRIAGVPRLAS